MCCLWKLHFLSAILSLESSSTSICIEHAFLAKNSHPHPKFSPLNKTQVFFFLSLSSLSPRNVFFFFTLFVGLLLLISFCWVTGYEIRDNASASDVRVSVRKKRVKKSLEVVQPEPKMESNCNKVSFLLFASRLRFLFVDIEFFFC